MRAIKFRGKSLETDDWVYGFLADGNLICTWDNRRNSHEVLSTTVGQFTGLTDKNGKETYEGDILLWTRKNVHIEGRPVQDLLYKCVVYYDNDKCSFQFRCKLSCGACVGCLDFDDDRADESFVEVIGNVFDNSSLIEKGGQDAS